VVTPFWLPPSLPSLAFPPCTPKISPRSPNAKRPLFQISFYLFRALLSPPPPAIGCCASETFGTFLCGPLLLVPFFSNFPSRGRPPLAPLEFIPVFFPYTPFFSLNVFSQTPDAFPPCPLIPPTPPKYFISTPFLDLHPAKQFLSS